VLGMLVIVLGLYISISPFLPNILYFFHHKTVVPYSGKLASYYGGSSNKNTAPPAENRLVIPDININEKILESDSIRVIDHNGVWRRPATSNDPKKGNMVIIGHRYLYTNPYGTFYHLDKLKVGSKMAIYWDKAEHVYQVSQIKVTDSHQTEVEAPTKTPQLTLYTCTPLISGKDRLVIIATEIK